MATLRSRRSAAQLHAIAGVEREIRATDHNGRRKYLLDFSEAFRSYESILPPGKLSELIQQADILLIGDYHALRLRRTTLGDDALELRYGLRATATIPYANIAAVEPVEDWRKRKGTLKMAIGDAPRQSVPSLLVRRLLVVP